MQHPVVHNCGPQLSTHELIGVASSGRNLAKLAAANMHVVLGALNGDVMK